jgi:ACS family hexuronate transporter-like MFS transporter
MDSKTEIAPASRLRWLMISLVFAATVVLYIDRQALAVVAPVLGRQFHMSNVAYSRVVFAFMLAYTISNGCSGAFLDRVGTKIGYAVCMGWWAVAALLHALASGPLSLGVCRFLLGIGEAANWPAGVKVVAEWFPVRERALASGIFNSGSAIGAVAGPPLAVWVVVRFGWHAAFLGVGALAILWLAAWLLIYRSPATVENQRKAPPIPVMRLLRTRWVSTFTLSKVFSDPVWYFYIFWFPKYLASARGFDLLDIAKLAWVPFATADVGNLIGGWLSSVLLRIGIPALKSRKICVMFFATLAMSSIPAVLCHNVYGAIALISLATLGYTGALSNMLAMPADVFPPNAVGSIWGLASMGSGFGGMIFSLATGWVVDHYSFTPVFFGFGILPLIAAAIVWTLPPGAHANQ